MTNREIISRLEKIAKEADELMLELRKEDEKFSYERFARGEIAINCRTEQDAVLLFKFLAAKGITWSDGDSLDTTNLWSDYEADSCYMTHAGVGLLYDSLTYARQADKYTIFEFEIGMLED